VPRFDVIQQKKRDTDLKTQEALNKLRNEMKKSLYELEIYEQLSKKEEDIRKMLADAVKGLSQKSTVQIVK